MDKYSAASDRLPLSKTTLVDVFGDAFAGVPITYVHQRKRLGLGHAVLQAEAYVDGTFLF